jgi:hypothetical protein
MSMTRAHPREEPVVADDSMERGVQDRSGLGFVGMTLGVVAGFLLAFYYLVPAFPRDKATANLTLMTSVVMAAMTTGGAIGYILTRRRV